MDPYYVYNTSENTTRVNYYPPHTDGYRYTPYVWIDGSVRGGYSSGSWWNLTRTRVAVASPLEITIGGTYDDDARTGNLNIRIVATGAVTGTNIKTRIALTESEIHWNAPNGSTVHNQTMRDMIPSAAGTPTAIAEGDTVDMSQAFSCPATLNWNNCEVVVWVQADGNRDILQTAMITLTELYEQTGIDDNPLIPVAINLKQNYPNPFNANTQIGYSLPTESHVRLTVYDLTGREVVKLCDDNQGAGNYQINWNGADATGKSVSSGIYFYRLQTDDQTFTQRMTLLK